MADSYVYNGPHERLHLSRGVCLHRGVPAELAEDVAVRAAAVPGVERVGPTAPPAEAKVVAELGTPTSGEIRRWARGEGIGVPRKGRIPAAIVQAYLKAHGRE